MEALKVAEAKEILSKIDLSKLPFNMTLALVHKDEIWEHLRPPSMTRCSFPEQYALRLGCHVPDRETSVPVELFTHWPVYDESDIVKEALDLVLYYVAHETQEWFIVDGKRKFDPHVGPITLPRSWIEATT